MEQQAYQVCYGGSGLGDRYMLDMTGGYRDEGEKPWHYEIMRDTKELFKIYPDNWDDYHGHSTGGDFGCIKHPLPLRKIVYLGDVWKIGIVHKNQELQQGEVDFYDLLNKHEQWNWCGIGVCDEKLI